MKVPTGEFLRKLRDYNKLINFAAYRYRIPGVLDQEDLYQEGLIILENMFRKYDHHPDSIDFQKLFKTELWHGLNKVLQKHKQAKRDHRKVVNFDYSYRSLADDEERTSSEDSYLTASQSPESLALSVEDESDAAEFIQNLTERLDAEHCVILQELLQPREWKDIPEQYRLEPGGGVYWREPKSGVPQHVIADILGIPRIRLKRAIKRIRKAASELAHELGMNQVKLAGIKFFEKKEKNHVKQSLSGGTVLQFGTNQVSGDFGDSDREFRVVNLFSSQG